jgi:hypothetical protein
MSNIIFFSFLMGPVIDQPVIGCYSRVTWSWGSTGARLAWAILAPHLIDAFHAFLSQLSLALRTKQVDLHGLVQDDVWCNVAPPIRLSVCDYQRSNVGCLNLERSQYEPIARRNAPHNVVSLTFIGNFYDVVGDDYPNLLVV